MTLNVAQYLAPLNSQQVLTGYAQGVKDGSGLTIAPDGTISLSKTEAAVLGFIVSSGAPAPVLNWSSIPGTPSSVLMDDGNGNVGWAADYVQTFPIGEPFPHTGAALLPVGTTAERPIPGIAGFLRYNTDENYNEFFNGGAWLPVTQGTGAVFSTVSNTAPTPHAPGDFWYDTATQGEFVWTGTTWAPTTPPQPGYSFIEFDTVAPLFDGSVTNFPLTVDGAPYAPSPSSNIMVFLGGVIQFPGAGNSYSVFGSTIIFTTPPPVGMSFYATTVG
jgi:hypothetical protein